ncbi:MAG: nitrate/nitrite transport system permease protein [Oceanospirillaceae bacterium]|jgi:nitrate/nitrite transport system permease protein
MSIATLTSKFSMERSLPECIKEVLESTVKKLIAPVLGILVFLMLWSLGAQNMTTSLGKFPGPGAVVEQFSSLYGEHVNERKKADDFYARQDLRNAKRMAKDPNYVPKIRNYTGKKTIVDQIFTSIVTVMSGFLVAAMIAVPLGIMLGLSQTLNSAFNPIIQIFKPVSPLAWLPLVTMVVSSMYVSEDPLVAKSFLNSMITVTLCSLWPMVINTAIGVASVDKDLMNVSKVLRLSTFTHIQKIVIPAATPMIFTGMRLSLSVAWMVLIAAEMLAQNPGLGKFVWDEFQNGSSQSLARIMTAVVIIGVIGYLLDLVMLKLQRFAAWDKSTTAV